MNVVVEGQLDAVVAQTLADHCDVLVESLHVKNGKPNLLGKLDGYNSAAQRQRFLVIVDLDADYTCAPEFLSEVLPHRSPGMTCRVAVRAIEAWIMADRSRLSAFLGVRLSSIPTDVDSLPDPKGRLVDAARTSRKNVVKRGMPPRAGSGRRVGPSYTSLMIEFVTAPVGGWSVDDAAANSPSLARTVEALRSL